MDDRLSLDNYMGRRENLRTQRGHALFARQSLSVWLVLVLLCGTAPSQRRGRLEQAEPVQLTIRVVLPTGHPGPERLRVELFNGTGIPVAEGVTDGLGLAVFPNLREGNYEVRITGMDVEDTRASFTLYPTMHAIEHVQVQPRAAGATTAQRPPRSGAISAADLKTPPQAKEEFRKGTQALAQQDWQEARKRLQRAIELYPDYAQAYNNLGVAFMNSSDPLKGREAFEKAVQINGSYAPGYINLARITSSEHKSSEAEAFLKKALKAEPLNPEALYLLADLKLGNGEYDEAIRYARSVHSVPHQRFAAAHYVCASALQAKGLGAEATAEYQTFLNEDPQGELAPQARAALQSLDQSRH